MEYDFVYFTARDAVCEEPTPTSGVTVLQPHTTTVSSVIIYQCQQSGFAPSVPSSVCGEDGRWTPDPTQVVCMMTLTTTLPTSASPAGIVGEYRYRAIATSPVSTRPLLHSLMPWLAWRCQLGPMLSECPCMACTQRGDMLKHNTRWLQTV